jgi:siroheme synthase
VPAYAGVPVTHRGVSKSVTVVTGQSDPWAAPETDWDAVARLGGTIILYMAVANRGEIAARLVAAGLDPATPVVAITDGSRPSQQAVRTTLDALGAADIRPPATIVIGAVAGLDLAWFTPER